MSEPVFERELKKNFNFYPDLKLNEKCKPDYSHPMKWKIIISELT